MGYFTGSIFLLSSLAQGNLWEFSPIFGSLFSFRLFPLCLILSHSLSLTLPPFFFLGMDLRLSGTKAGCPRSGHSLDQPHSRAQLLHTLEFSAACLCTFALAYPSWRPACCSSRAVGSVLSTDSVGTSSREPACALLRDTRVK